MVSILDQTGLTIESNPQIVSDLVAAFKTIYGNDINVDSNSPDGQLIQIFAQAVTDQLELLADAYNAMAVPTSYGARLDQLVALNGITRKQGTFTQAQVLVTANAALTLPGLDQTAVTPFTVADNAGNQFELLTSYVFSGAGSATLTFQAVTVGQVQTTANTITNIITSTLGITTVNNPSVTSDILGVNEETDAQLKVRQAQAFNLATTGPSDSMESALRNIPDVIDAMVVENNTSGTVNGTAAYSVWPIVNGGTSVEIAMAIYVKKSPGTPMRGSQSQVITRPNGQTFTAQWDNAIGQPLYVKFSIIWIGAPTMANSDILAALAVALSYKLGQNPTIGDIVKAMAIIAPTAVLTINSASQGVSRDNSTWASVVTPTDAQRYFTVSASNMAIV